LSVLVTIYRGLAKPDYIQMCQCLLFLQQPQTVAEVLDDLIRIDVTSHVAGNDIHADDKLLMAYQVAFDLQENQNQPFLNAVIAALPTPAGSTPTATAATDAKATPTTPAATATGAAATTATTGESKEEDSYASRTARLKGILSGDIPVNVQLNYLYGHNRSDLNILKLIKDKLEPRNMVTHNATVLAHAIMHVGTTSDTFLRDNLEWLAKATNWAKFSATASIGVIHKGHHKESQKLLGPYLPQPGTSGSPYQEGGALYALGLIHANHGHDQVEFLMTALRNSGNNEIVQHGACLGLGLAAMATSNRTVYDFLKTSVLFTENAVAGEAAALAMGLVLLGTANGAALEEMVAYAHDTRHEKIIRGIAMGIALIVYGVEEQADVLIEQLLTDKDPLLRYGGMYAIAMAYCGNNAIRRLLHSSVSDVSDDVRRAAVTGLGFVLCNKPDEVPRVVNLLSESYNSHVRYGAALAIGIACAGTGNKDALNVLEPLCKDRVDLTRQGALIATSMVLIQHNDVKEPKVKTFRKTLAEAQALKGDTMTKLGAIFAAGILDAGGRNVTMSLLSSAGHKKMAAVVGMAMFPQYWYWYPYTHFISLAFTPTAVIGLSKNMKMPKSFAFTSQARPSLFAIPPDVEIKKAEEKKVVKTSTLSVTAKAKARAKKKGADGNDMDTSDDKTTPAATPRPGDTPKNVGAAAATAGTDTKLPEGAAGSAAKDGDTVMATETDKKDEKTATETKTKEEADKKAAEEKKPEPEFEVLTNPSRVTWAQQKHITYDAAQRYQPIKPVCVGPFFPFLFFPSLNIFIIY
jgi:26S proteasome regulatory subunit N2